MCHPCVSGFNSACKDCTRNSGLAGCLELHLLGPHALHCGISGGVIRVGAAHVVLAKVLAEPPVILLLHILVGIPDDAEVILSVSAVHEATQGRISTGPLPALAPIGPVA